MSEASSPGVQPKLAERLREFFVSPSFGLGLAGAVLLWAAFPPVNLPWLAWVAPLPWLWLVRLPQLPGRKPYLALWLCGTIFWLAMLYGVRMAHPALNAGWVALSVYLGVYLPAFVGLSRIAVQRLNVSMVIAAPVVWVGLEVLRGYLVTGFSIGLLAHTQAEFPLLIQIADLAGGYTLSFVIMLVAASLARILPQAGTYRLWPAVPATIALALTVAYGTWRLEQEVPGAVRKPLKVALIQGSLDTKFLPPEQIPQRMIDTYEHYGRLTNEAAAKQPNLDLVIWPESMFMIPERIIEEPLAPLPGIEKPVEELRYALDALQAQFYGALKSEAARANQNTSAGRETKFLFGTNNVTYGGAQPPRSYNAALLADREGNLVGRYYKTHAVMFGEYIPLGDWFPFLYSFVPIGGISVGNAPEAFEVASYKLSPSICFESTVPHLIRGQTVELARRGTPADVLVNLTNDGWFWGSSILDLHFRCGVFRAVENRKPLIVAANTGIATWVDGNGAIRQRGAKRQPQVLIAEVRPDGRSSPYHTLGDLPGWLCAAACVVLAAAGFRRRRADEREAAMTKTTEP